MKHVLRIGFLLVLMLALAAALTPVYAGNGNPRVLPPQSAAYGQTYAAWSAAWWQWAFPFPTSENPVTDETGEFCHAGQSGPVFFLAGNTGGTTTRHCTVPAGKALWFPIVNIVAWKPGDADTEQGLRELAAWVMDYATGLEAEVDGVSIQNLDAYRVQSPLFPFTVPPDNLFGIPEPYQRQGISDGVWLMLAPLPPGQHTIHFQGAIHIPDVFDLELDVTYHLTVTP